MGLDGTVTSALEELKRKIDTFVQEGGTFGVYLEENPTLQQANQAQSKLHNILIDPKPEVLSSSKIKAAYKLRKRLEDIMEDQSEYNQIKKEFVDRRERDLDTIKVYMSDLRKILPTDKSSAPVESVQDHLQPIQYFIDIAGEWYAPEVVGDLESIKNYFTNYIKDAKAREQKIASLKKNKKKQQIKDPRIFTKRRKSPYILAIYAILAAMAGAYSGYFSAYWHRPRTVISSDPPVPNQEKKFPAKKFRTYGKKLEQSNLRSFIQQHDMYEKASNPDGDHPNRYVNSKGGTLTDISTGLQWETRGQTWFVKYFQAEDHINSLNYSRFAGHKDWRMPTMEELLTINEKTVQLYNTNEKKFIHLDDLFNSDIAWALWSSDAIGKTSHWRLDARDGVAGFASKYQYHAGCIGVRTIE